MGNLWKRFQMKIKMKIRHKDGTGAARFITGHFQLGRWSSSTLLFIDLFVKYTLVSSFFSLIGVNFLSDSIWNVVKEVIRNNRSNREGRRTSIMYQVYILYTSNSRLPNDKQIFIWEIENIMISNSTATRKC